MKTTLNMVSTHLENYDKRPQLLNHDKIDPKRNVHTLKGTMTLQKIAIRVQKSVIFVYTSIYTGSFHQNLLESKPILVDSSSILGHHLLFLFVVLIHWNEVFIKHLATKYLF